MGTAKTPEVLNGYKWELYNIADDYSENNDLAAKYPDKLRELQELFLVEAQKYQVFPLDRRPKRSEWLSVNLSGRLLLLTLTPRWNFARTIAYRSDSGAFRAGRDQIHFGENLKFTPSALNLNFFGSQNWVDPLVGGRIQLALTEKIAITALGDVGGWGVGSQLEYQAGGLLGYRIKPNWTPRRGIAISILTIARTGPALLSSIPRCPV
jgi:hypothetical protein